jgi:[protein-PII] uridylyltransferase
MLTRLYLLTFADTSAVGPGIWTSWKGSLLKDLFLRALKRYEPAKTAEAPPDIIEEFKIGLSEKAARFAGGMPDRYYLIRDSAHAEEDARLYNQLVSTDEPVVIGTRFFSADEPGEIAIVARDELGLLYRLLGTFASKNISILDSQIFTRKDGIALDIFRVAGQDGKPVTDERLLARIETEIKKIVAGETNVEDLLRQRKKMISLGDDLPHVEPSVDILNDVSLEHTVIEVVSRDRIGLLYDIARSLAENGAEIVSARISTEGHRAVNAFYVSETDGKKIFHSDRVKVIKKALLAIL